MTGLPRSQPSSPEAPTLLALKAREAGYKKRIEELEEVIATAENRLEAALLGDEVCEHCVDLARSDLRAALQGDPK